MLGACSNSMTTRLRSSHVHSVRENESRFLGVVVLTKNISRRTTTTITSTLLSTLPFSSFLSRDGGRRGPSSSFHLLQGILLGLLKGR